jgi:hypothetical protein
VMSKLLCINTMTLRLEHPTIFFIAGHISSTWYCQLPTLNITVYFVLSHCPPRLAREYLTAT